jgi:molecular chaperone GrpE
MSDHDKKPEAWPAPAPAEPGDPPCGDAEERVRALEAELAAARSEVKEQEDRWLRERAEVENFKKRMARERADMVRFANEALLKDLLPIVDNLERAVEHARGGGNGQPLVDGVALVLKAFLDVLERHGVSRIAAKGTPFDPAQHEAMAQVATDAHAPNSVVEEHQAGYRLHDRLLRPALVSVAKAPDNLVKPEGRD